MSNDQGGPAAVPSVALDVTLDTAQRDLLDTLLALANQPFPAMPPSGAGPATIYQPLVDIQQESTNGTVRACHPA
ncbi:MAG: hypothetical protein WCY98_06510 [Castellaniella sp.]